MSAIATPTVGYGQNMYHYTPIPAPIPSHLSLLATLSPSWCSSAFRAAACLALPLHLELSEEVLLDGADGADGALLDLQADDLEADDAALSDLHL